MRRSNGRPPALVAAAAVCGVLVAAAVLAGGAAAKPKPKPNKLAGVKSWGYRLVYKGSGYQDDPSAPTEKLSFGWNVTYPGITLSSNRKVFMFGPAGRGPIRPAPGRTSGRVKSYALHARYVGTGSYTGSDGAGDAGLKATFTWSLGFVTLHTPTRPGSAFFAPVDPAATTVSGAWTYTGNGCDASGTIALDTISERLVAIGLAGGRTEFLVRAPGFRLAGADECTSDNLDAGEIDGIGGYEFVETNRALAHGAVVAHAHRLPGDGSPDNGSFGGTITLTKAG